MDRRDLFPGQPRVELLQAAAKPAAQTDRRRLPGPAAARLGARLEMVVAREAQDHQVGLRVVAALQNPAHVVHVELAVGPGHAADLASGAARGDQAPAPGGRQPRRARAPVVGVAHAVAKRALGEQGSERAAPAGRARSAQGDQVGRGRGTPVVDQEEVERPRPLDCAALARAATAREHGGPSAGGDAQAERFPHRTHVRRAV